MNTMDLRSEPWWPSCIAELAKESLEQLADRYEVDVDELAAALGEEGRDGPAHHAVWWPLAIRQIEAGASIRSVARRFGTEPRRIRRALARTGARAGGESFGADGLSALQPFLDRLGKEPDARVAKEAGVAVEAVQGERRRRGIAPFRQRATRRARLSQDDMMWIRGPKRNRREKFKPDAEVQVVRRPAHGSEAPPVMVRRPAGEAGHFEAAPRFPSRPGWGGAAPEGRRAFEPRPERPAFRSEREQEIEQLLNMPRRQRDGRQRIVRADSGRPEAPPEPERIARPARRSAAPTPGWRPVDPTRAPEAPVELPGIIRRAEVEARRVEPSEAPPMLRREPGSPVVRREARRPDAEPLRPSPELLRRAEAQPERSEPHPPEAAGAPEPLRRAEAPVRRMVREVVPVRAEPAREAAREPARAEPARREPTRTVRRVVERPAAPEPEGEVAWYLEVPGWEEPLVLYAADITGVILQASTRLDPDVLAHATIWRVGEPRPGV